MAASWRNEACPVGKLGVGSPGQMRPSRQRSKLPSACYKSKQRSPEERGGVGQKKEEEEEGMMKSTRAFSRAEPRRAGNAFIISSMLLSLCVLSLIRARYSSSAYGSPIYPSYAVFRFLSSCSVPAVIEQEKLHFFLQLSGRRRRNWKR